MRSRFWKFFLEYATPVFAAIAFITMLSDVISVKGYSFTGAEIMFGCSKAGLRLLNFNILAVLAYLCPLAGGILVVYAVSKRRQDNVKIFEFIAAGLLIVGTVLLFLLPEFWHIFADGQQLKNYFKVMDAELLLGGNMGAICSLLGAVSMLASCFIELK